MAASGAHKQFIHGLIEQSRERVVQVRAGQSLVLVLHEEHRQHSPPKTIASQARRHPHAGHPKKTNGVTHSTSLPNIPTMKLVYEARRHADADAKGSSSEAQSDVSAMRKNLRKRGVLAAASTTSSSTTSLITTTTPTETAGSLDRRGSVADGVSSTKFIEYILSKSAQVETLHQNDRRRAITRSTRKIAQLAIQQFQSQSQLQSTGLSSETEAAKVLFARTLAAMKAKKALLSLKKAAPSPSEVPDLASKNPHFAFLDFKKEDNDQRQQQQANHAPRAVGLDESNTKKRMPIHFGDQICFISESSDLPLSMGPNGRSCHVSGLSAGLHMMFTITDFKNPTRRSAVTADDEFWLRVDASLIHRSTSENGEGDDLDVSHLLSETQYYLGCAGSIEDSDSVEELPGTLDHHHHQFQHPSQNNKENLRGSTLSNALPPSHSSPQKTHKTQGYDTFRLIAIKATVPSVEYYGDDKATREYTVETNESTMRLARWRFTLNTHATTLPRATAASKHRSQNPGGADSVDDDEVDSTLLLNCSSVYLSLNHFVLECDATLSNRGVLRDYSARCSGTTTSTAGVQDATHLLRKRGKTFGSVASWQVRLLHQAVRPPLSPTGAKSPVPGKQNHQQLVVKELLESPAEWLKKKQETIEKNEAAIRGKKALARTAKRSYERVADQSNRKLVEIEQHKARHHVEYFQSHYHTIFEDEQGDNGEKIHHQRHRNSDRDGNTNQRINSRTTTLLLPRIR